MKREILFRGKDAYTGEWIESMVAIVGEKNGKSFALMVSRDSVAITEELISDRLICKAVVRHVIPETVGQYTGLTDKNGKKIFEGDIVKDEYGRIMSVVWKWNRLVFKLLRCKEKWTDNFTYADLKQWFDDGCPFPEIIGNIHDNPELLGKE